MGIDGRRAVVRRAARPRSATCVVARTRGAPVDAGGGLDAAARAALPAPAARVRPALARRSTSAGLGRRGRARAREHARGPRLARRARADARRADRPPAARADEDPPSPRARAALYRRYGAGGRPLRVGRETIDRLTVLGRLATEPDPAARRDLFEALAPVWRAVDGDGGDAQSVPRLLRATAARWADGRLADRGERGRSRLRARTARGDVPRRSSRPGGPCIGPDRIEPWDYRYCGRGGGRRLDALVPADRLLGDQRRATWRRSARIRDELGISLRRPAAARPPAHPGRVHARDGRLGADQPATGPGRRARRGSSRRTRRAASATSRSCSTRAAMRCHGRPPDAPGLPRVTRGDAPRSSRAPPTSSAGTSTSRRGSAAGWATPREPREALLDRYGAVMLDVCWALFEIVLHRHPDRRPNDVWSEITADGLGIEPHPEWSWWAVRGQLIDSPGYLANYALSAIVAAAVRARIARASAGRGSTAIRAGTGSWRAAVRGRGVAAAGGPAASLPRRAADRRAAAGRPPPTPAERSTRPQTGITTSASTATARNSRLR